MKRVLPLILSLALLLPLAGCASGLTIFSNYRRIENIELVRTVTADKRGEGVNVAIYGTAGDESEGRMYERSGPSIGVAMGELILLPLGREAILSHTESMLIGEEQARASLRECLDYVERFSEMRLDTGILIVRGGTARDLLAGISGEDTPASDIIAGLDRSISRVGGGYVFTCREIAASLAANGCALAQCVRGVQEEKLFEERGDLNLEPDGFAVIKDGAVRAFLTQNETLGATLLLDRLRSVNLDLPIDGGEVTVSVDLIKTRLEPEFDNEGELRSLKLPIELRASVISLTGETDIMDPRVREKCERELTRVMTDAAQSAVDRSQELNIDYLDLGGMINRREAIKFADMNRPWRDVFPTLPIEVEGTSVLSRTYDIADPPELTGKEDSLWEKLTESLKDS